jgi:hypothetical protein
MRDRFGFPNIMVEDGKARWWNRPDRARSDRRGAMIAIRFFSAVLAAVLIMTTAGCSSTKLVNLWTDPKYTGPSFKKILVIGISERSGERRLFEEEFVRRLDMRDGVDALPSIGLIDEQSELDTERITEAIKGTGIDAVLVTRLVSEETRKRDSQVRTGSFDEYYFRASRTIRSKEYITEHTIVKLETNVYTAETMALVWSGTTETFNPPKSIAKTIDELAKIVVESLADNGML